LDRTTVRPFTRGKPVCAPRPAHLPRERIVLPGPAACPCCGSKLAKLGESITETLEVVPRQWKVVQTVRETLRKTTITYVYDIGGRPAAGPGCRCCPRLHESRRIAS
jgi:transposase